MYGNILNSGGIDKLEKEKKLIIDPYDPLELRTIHYPVYPEFIKKLDDEGEWVTIYSLMEKKKKFELAPYEYVQVVINEHIKLPKEIVGEFILASNTIDSGLGIHAGRIEYPFGQRRERMHIGVQNLLNRPNFIEPNQKIAYIRFIDTTGVKNIESVELSHEDMKRFEARIIDKVKLWQEDGGSMFDPREVTISEKKKK